MQLKYVATGLLTLMINAIPLAWAVTGQETAELLNSRYKLLQDTCTGIDGGAAYLCSGVLLHGKAKEAYLPFWRHDLTSERLGAEPLTYLRADIGTRTLATRSGVVVGKVTGDLPNSPVLDVLCAYPFAPSIKIDWTHYGCLTPSDLQSAELDQSSCLSARVTTAQDWLEHFQKVDSNPDRQCSVSTRDPVQFMVGVQAHDMLGSEWSIKPNLLLVKNWEKTPEAIPAVAIFHDPTQENSLLEAQRHQLDYFKETDRWLPVLKINLSEPQQNIFTYSPEEQLYIGYEVAARMNARYMDTRPECPDGNAAFYCNGILLRGVWASTEYHSWNPSPGSIINNGVSFSYLRADLGIKVMFGFSGLIFKSSDSPAPTPITVRCAYPYEAGTSGSPDPCTFAGVCETSGVTNLIIWTRNYKNTGISSCAFTNSARQFAVANQVTEKFVKGGYNEIMVAAWPTDVPALIPLEAVVHRSNVTSYPSLEQSQYIQRDYYTQTGRYLPLVSMSQTEPENPIFSFDPLIQNQPGSPDPRPMKDGVPIQLNAQEQGDRGR
ncbi:hypothetical protein [Pseudomonas sp. DSP3-2-2]|uniref:hypothetical protein n=1 Tax=unclassified Pseudomonas TaxID=196821 RepID=UPI003CF90A0F